MEESTSLDTETGLAPVSSLSVVSNGVTSPEANPLRDGTVLLLSFGKLLLGTETLVARHLDGLSRRRAELYGLAEVRLSTVSRSFRGGGFFGADRVSVSLPEVM
jgi:hypothetical protein